MLSDDVIFYLKEFNRILKPGGRVYMTAFVEENVPEEEENPATPSGLFAGIPSQLIGSNRKSK